MRRRRHGFGSVDQGSYKYSDELETGAEKTKSGDNEESGGLGVVGKTITGALGSGNLMGDLCGCANKDKQEENKKKKELEDKYPLMDCGLIPSSSCKAYNEQQQKKRDAEFDAWKEAKDQQVADEMSDSAREKFAFANEIAQELASKLPSSAQSLTLAQIAKQYPAEFNAAYKKLQGKYPMFATVPAELALAMNPDIANMKLSDFIRRTGTLGGKKKSSAGTVALAGGGIAALGLLGYFFLRKK